MSKRIKKYGERAMDMTVSSIGLGAGAMVVGRMPVPASVNAAGGLGTMSRFMPMMGTMYGAETVLGMASDLQKKNRRRK